MKSIFSQDRMALTTEIATQFGELKSQLRAERIFKSIYKEPQAQKFHFPLLSEEVKRWLGDSFEFSYPLEIHDLQTSTHDGSVKFAMRLKKDGKLVESVLIPERGRLTQCISTQVGCAQACRFCQTGRMGLLRNLETEEIIAQILVADLWRKQNPTHETAKYKQITNVVYMGMGEPLDNIDNVITSTHILCDHLGLNFSPNKVTISTVGLLPQLEKILRSTKVAVALSLHSPYNAERSKIMPVNIRHSITDVVAVLRQYSQLGLRRSFMIQYTLLRGINDSSAHAKELVALLAGVSAKINLIPLNEHEGAAYRRPDLGRVYAFQQELKNAGMVATVRLSKGRDIQAACGQLIKDKVKQQNELF